MDGSFQSGRSREGYDIRNDQALSDLQTTADKKGADRYRTVRLREICLAGIVAYRHNGHFGQFSFCR